MGESLLLYINIGIGGKNVDMLKKWVLSEKKSLDYFAINKLVVYLHSILHQNPVKGGKRGQKVLWKSKNEFFLKKVCKKFAD